MLSHLLSPAVSSGSGAVWNITIVGGILAAVIVTILSLMMIVMVVLLRVHCSRSARTPLQYVYCRYYVLCSCRSVLSSLCSALYREPVRSVDIPTHTNRSYEMTKIAGEGAKGLGRGGVRRREEKYEYEDVVLSRHPPAQPVTAGENGYMNIS